MKKTIVLVFAVLTFYISNAQWVDPGNDGTGNIYYTNGSVGIGTSTPIRKLHVEQLDGTIQLHLKRSGNNAGIADIGADGNGLHFWVGGYDGLTNQELIIKPNGNIGVGTSTPESKLEVVGLSNKASIVLGNENFIGFKRSDGVLVYGIGHTNGEFTIGNSSNLGNGAGTAINIASGFSQIRFSQGGIERMRIATGGNVGIGKLTPTAKLHVDGNIIAEEIKVEDVTPADFVFESDYPLLSLEETEAFIKAHHHLPEVPSAAEMETNGVELGKMNMLLLQKIEELTLLMIQQQKQINKQNNKIEVQNTIITDFIKTQQN